MVFPFITSFSELRPSGLWHHQQASGQPLKKTVVRMPGPSWTENRWMLNMVADLFTCFKFISCMYARWAESKRVFVVLSSWFWAFTPSGGFSVLCSVFCVLCSVFWVLSSVFCVLCSVFWACPPSGGFSVQCSGLPVVVRNWVLLNQKYELVSFNKD